MGVGSIDQIFKYTNITYQINKKYFQMKYEPGVIKSLIGQISTQWNKHLNPMSKNSTESDCSIYVALTYIFSCVYICSVYFHLNTENGDYVK